ncbi:MAG TPA: hypothetical protein VFX16_11370 [Pseudonocardiaceae bacterium]|nr:hypothetical protein [Pseudonocardiaceae bacterium]
MARPGVFEPHLASALNNLSDDFLALGDAENALAAAPEAVALRTPLARDNPAVLEPLLASLLSTTGAALLVLGRLDEAAEYADMAVAAYRAASENRPDAFVGRLAAALGNPANIRLARQDVTGALSATGR